MGTGVMGCAMAGHLMDAGYELKVFNRTRAKTKPLTDRGAVLCNSPKECAAGCDLVISVVGTPTDVREVWLDENTGAFAGMKKGAFALDMTTSDPALAEELYTKAAASGFSMADCPVTGGDVGAANATLTMLFGGDRESFDVLQPVLSAMGSKLHYFGSAGKGQIAKACNQIACAGTMFSLCESLFLAQNAGLDCSLTVSALGSGAGGSFSMNSYGPRIIKEDRNPGFRIRHFVKDLKIALSVAESLNIKLNCTELALKAYALLESKGYGDEGTQSLYRLYEQQLNKNL